MLKEKTRKAKERRNKEGKSVVERKVRWWADKGRERGGTAMQQQTRSGRAEVMVAAIAVRGLFKSNTAAITR